MKLTDAGNGTSDNGCTNVGGGVDLDDNIDNDDENKADVFTAPRHRNIN